MSYKEIKPVDTVEIENNAVKQKPNNVRLIRNINLESILDCRAFDGMSIKVAYKDALEKGKMCRFFTMPSVFKDSYKGDYEAFTVTMKTITGQMSIFSPVIYKTLLNEADKYMFKVPSLRNVEMTGPYFHDGSVATLDEAIKIMAKTQVNKEITNLEMLQIKTFLKTLTGTVPKELMQNAEE